MFAIISDIHANLEALNVVLSDIEPQGAEEILCLGDIVGYGPDPEECIDIVRERCSVCLMGNHDHAVLFGAEGFNPAAEEAVNYHRERLMPQPESSGAKKDRWEWLRMLPSRHERDDFLFVHGSPRNPISEYVLESDVKWGFVSKLESMFAVVKHHCFVGHSHRPGIVTEDLRFLRAEEIDNVYDLPEQKSIINVGSVGQPRDKDSRACYVTIEEGQVLYHRLEYDYGLTQTKIAATGRLDASCGDRLAEGR